MGLVDLKSNLAKQTANVAYVNNIIDSEKTPSPIEISHNNNPAVINFTTRNGPMSRNIPNFPLATYYSQLNTEGKLGIRKSSKFGPEQPFVVRKIVMNMIMSVLNFQLMIIYGLEVIQD